jgi:predicted TIM-barrel fold metal-dependent hydrolase
MSESGKYGPTRCIAGIIGFVDLQLGSRAKGVLERHIAVSDGRLRAIRNGSTWSDDPTLKTFTAGSPKGLLLDNNFREGFAALAPLGLAFDGWMFQTQLDDLVDLARAFPQTQCGHHGLAGASST